MVASFISGRRPWRTITRDAHAMLNCAMGDHSSVIAVRAVLLEVPEEHLQVGIEAVGHCLVVVIRAGKDLAIGLLAGSNSLILCGPGVFVGTHFPDAAEIR